ncbi:hypothetical protein LAZ67_X004431, partial [Cordylochernes scorpioides]
MSPVEKKTKAFPLQRQNHGHAKKSYFNKKAGPKRLSNQISSGQCKTSQRATNIGSKFKIWTTVWEPLSDRVTTMFEFRLMERRERYLPRDWCCGGVGFLRIWAMERRMSYWDVWERELMAGSTPEMILGMSAIVG